MLTDQQAVAIVKPMLNQVAQDLHFPGQVDFATGPLRSTVLAFCQNYEANGGDRSKMQRECRDAWQTKYGCPLPEALESFVLTLMVELRHGEEAAEKRA